MFGVRLAGLRIFLALALLFGSDSAFAEVEVTFYSHELGDSFPHAFFTTKGTIEATGAAVDDNYGFTASAVSPAILFGSVNGKMDKATPKYIKSSDVRFSLTVSDADYAKLMTFIEQWAAQPQKNYNLNRRNCIHFVMEAAEILGLKVNRQSKFFKKPRSFLEEVKSLNPELQQVPESMQESVTAPVPAF